MIRVFSSALSAAKMFAAQRNQYTEIIQLSGQIAAASGTLARAAVSNLGHFLCLKITGSFSTLYNQAVLGVIDDGVDHLRGMLIDGAGQRKLFSDFIPLSLWLSPGRMRSSLAGNAWGPLAGPPAASVANPSGSLFYPTEFEYLFSANSEIQVDLRNDGNTTQYYEIAFHGIRILSGVSVAGVKGA